MIESATGGLRFALDLPSPHEPRRYRVRPVSGDETGAVEELLQHAPGVKRTAPPSESPQAASVRLGAFDDMRVLRAFVDLRAGAPSADACFVELMVVDPRHRRAGLGAHLFATLAAQLKAAGARRIALEVDDDNDGAARFWTRQGFTPTARSDGRQGVRAEAGLGRERLLSPNLPHPRCHGPRRTPLIVMVRLCEPRLGG